MSNHLLPIIRRLPDDFSLSDAFGRLANFPGCLWLDTAALGPFVHSLTETLGTPRPDANRLGRYSFLTADPVDQIIASPDDPSPWKKLDSWSRSLPSDYAEFLPPFQGGIAGLIGFDASAWLETVPRARIDDFSTPAMSVGLYDWTIATDHRQNISWIVSQGLGAADQEDRLRLANERADQVESWLAGGARRSESGNVEPSSQPSIPKHYVVTERDNVWSNFTSDQYQSCVADIIDRIRHGDSFQVNLAQRLLVRATQASPDLYRQLRECNAAPYGAYYAGNDERGKPFQVLSSSPEGFLQIRNRHIETRPIKGTVSRTGSPEADLRLAKQLLRSEKDRAENMMIVDLMRNDFSRVCADESVKVSQLCGLEQYEHVQHLVSVVEGELEPDKTAVDALRACFPGGSVTGAPKIEAMRTIAELEPHCRGPYCGSLGYISCGGNADFNILIRTITAADGYWQIPVGGGVTSRSEPDSEEAETWAKAEGMLRALPSE